MILLPGLFSPEQHAEERLRLTGSRRLEGGRGPPSLAGRTEAARTYVVRIGLGECQWPAAARAMTATH
jgi:hypothetical protein